MADEDAKFVGTIPAAYDDGLGPVIFAPFADDLAARVRESVRRGRLLEVACGTGLLTRRLTTQLSPEVLITATDLNDAMILHAKTKVPPSSRLDWRVADAVALPFPSGTFDAVACQFGLMFVPDKLAALREARRVLKPGGMFFFNVWCRIEDNAFARVVHETIAKFFDDHPPTFYQVPFGYHDEAVIQAHLDQVGFVHSTRQRVRLEISASSTRQFARGLVEGNPIVHSIRDAGLSTPMIIDAVAAALAAEGGDAPFRSKANALVCTVRAP